MILWELQRWFNKWRFEHHAEVAVFFVLALLLTWPAPVQLSHSALGSAHADGMKHLWTLWWMRASVLEYQDFPFQTDLINYPVGMDLYPIEPLNGLVSCLFPFLGLVAVSNVLAILNLALTGICGAWFGRILSGSRWGGFAAGGILQGSAAMAFFIHVGVGELNHLWWLPLGLGCLVKARRTLEWKWFFAVSFSLIGAVISCFYLGFFLALATLLWSVFTIWAGRETPGLLFKYICAAGLAIAIVLPVTQSFSTSYKSGDIPEVGMWNYITKNYGQPVTDPPSARLEPGQLLEPKREAQRREEAAYGGGRYLGWLPVLLAIGGIVRRPKDALPWLLVGSAGILFACGSYLTVGGEEVRSNGIRLVMPIFWLNRALGYIAEPLNFPVRFMAVTATAVAAMAALAIREWKLALLVPLALVEVSWGQMLDWPWARFAPRDASALEAIRGIDDLAAVDLALVVRSDMENRYSALSSQIVHGKRTHAVPVERIEYFARDGYYFVAAMKLFKDLGPVYENRSTQMGADYRKDIALLRDAGFGWIVVSYRKGNERMPQGIMEVMGRLFGSPAARDTGLGAWRLPEVEYTPEELAAWQNEHLEAIRVVARTTPGMAPPLR
jgi:hypothetical protein